MDLIAFAKWMTGAEDSLGNSDLADFSKDGKINISDISGTAGKKEEG